jgi:hypothetical protein
MSNSGDGLRRHKQVPHRAKSPGFGMAFYGVRGSDDRFVRLVSANPPIEAFAYRCCFSRGELRDAAQLGLVNQAMVDSVQREFEAVGHA